MGAVLEVGDDDVTDEGSYSLVHLGHVFLNRVMDSVMRGERKRSSKAAGRMLGWPNRWGIIPFS